MTKLYGRKLHSGGPMGTTVYTGIYRSLDLGFTDSKMMHSHDLDGNHGKIRHCDYGGILNRYSENRD